MVSLAEWLQPLGLERYAEVFERNDVDLDVLPSLTDADLQQLGLSLGHRRKLLAAVAGHRPGELPATRSSATGVAPASAERRQLTVLFCDMVGYTELASRLDPEVLQGVVGSYEDTCAACVTRYEGYVFQRLGDGIVAFFGYPLAHEGEAERAVRAGLQIVEALSKLYVADAGHLAVRIGVATGLVVVSSVEKGAVGETMNLASRLQAIAQPGGIVVSDLVRRLAGGAFDYEDLGERTLKGIGRPTHAYRILGVSAAASRFEAAHVEAAATPLVGREQELGLLLERWQLAQDGEGQVVLLSGEPGIGKSRLLSALRERLEARRAQSLRFQCSPYSVNSAFWPSIDYFERMLRLGRDESVESKLDKLEALMLAHYGRPLSDVRYVASILSIPCEQRYGPLSMTPQKHKDETLRTLVDFIEAAARKQPSVMLLEDLHWSDPTTLEVMDLLIDRVRTFPLLIVLTHRSEFQSRWSQHGHVAALNLAKLTRAQSAALVSKVVGAKTLPGDLLEQILAKTDGVPLFVEELTRSVLESGELREAESRYEYSGTARTITIPATLRDSLMARLDRFTPVKEIAQIGAAIGREFSYELIQAVAPMATEQLDDALARLTESGLAFRRGTPPDATYTFKHALVQDAAYDSLLKSRKQELHGSIARVLEDRFPQTRDTKPELLAHHYTQAGRPRQAIPLWQRAGELALERMVLNESISNLNKGLELIGTLPRATERDAGELALRTVLGTAWIALGGWQAQEVWTSFHPALALAQSLRRNDALVPIFNGLRIHVLTRGRVTESLEWAKQALHAGKLAGDPALLLAGYAALTSSYAYMGELLEARRHGDQVLALYSEHEHEHIVHVNNLDPKTVVAGWATHWTWMLGYPDRAVRIADAKDQHARERGHPFNLCWALTFGAAVFDYRCEAEKYRERIEEAEQLGRKNSLPLYWEIFGPVMRGVALLRAGQAAEAVRLIRPALAIWNASGGKANDPYFKSALAEGMARLGDLEGALQLIDEMIAQVERPAWGERFHYAEILRLKGWMLSLEGDLDSAEANYQASLDWARRQQAKSWELRTATSLAKLWRSRGKRKEADDLLKPIYDWFTEGFDTRDLKEAKAVLDEISGHPASIQGRPSGT